MRGGDQLDQRRGRVLDEGRLHGLARPAARAGGCVFALQARVRESALGRAAGRAKGVSGALTQLPVQACGALPDGDWRKGHTVYATYFNYQFIYARATACGLPASIVQLAPIMGYLDSRFSVSEYLYKTVRVGGGCKCLFFLLNFLRTLRSR